MTVSVSECCKPPKAPVHSLVSVGTGARPLVVSGAVHVWAVVEGSVPSADGSAAPLVQEVPVETGKGTMLRTFMLHKQRALLRPELLQISEDRRTLWVSKQCCTSLQFPHVLHC